jgi:hypothetical protein
MKKILLILSIMLITGGTLYVTACSSPKCPADGTFGIYEKYSCDASGCHSVYKCLYGHYFFCD